MASQTKRVKKAAFFGPSLKQSVVLLSAIIIILLGAFAVVQTIEQQYKVRLINSLKTVLDSTSQAATLWGNNQRQIAENIAGFQYVVDGARYLLEAHRTKDFLIASPIQENFRLRLRPYLGRGQYKGYFIIGPGNLNLASSQDVNIGVPNLLLHEPDVLERLWAGESVISRVQKSDVSLTSGSEQNAQVGNETMFVGAPVRDELGDVIALLTLRIDPHETLFPLVGQGRLGETGETYAFDSHAVMLTRSRFEHHLRAIGLLQPGESSAAAIRILDPKKDLTLPGRTYPHNASLKMTVMAAEATQGQDGFNLDGYRDYRGVPVIGAWLWNSALNIGLTTEQDVAESYALFYRVRLLIYGGAVSAITLLCIQVLVFSASKRREEAAQQRLKAVVETAADAIILFNSEGVIESVNRAAERMFICQRDGLIGQHVRALMPGSDSEGQISFLQEYLEAQKMPIPDMYSEIIGRRLNGEIFPARLSVSPINTGDNQCFATIVRDVSKDKQLLEDLQQERDNAQAANRAKSTFLATMSHEIRTPLNGVVGTMDLLSHSRLNSQQENWLVTAQESAAQLQAVIDDILDFSKIEAGRLLLEETSLSLEALLENLADSVMPLAIKKGLNLQIYSDPQIPMVKGDSVRIRQILYNLAGNAIKFTGENIERKGCVIISVTLKSHAKGKVSIVISVKDNGIGMDGRERESLFKPFTQADAETTRRFGGTGLGLVITKRLVDMMRGTIQVVSEKGEGSEFIISLMLPESVDEFEFDNRQLEGVEAMLIADNELNEQIILNYLQSAGCAVQVFKCENLHALHGATPQPLVVMACDYSDELVQLKQSLGDTLLWLNPSPLHSTTEHSENMSSLSMNALRRKNLIDAVKAIYTGHLHATEPEVVEEGPSALFAAPRILLAEDNEVNQKVIGHQLEKLGCIVDVATDGLEALTMWRENAYSLLLTDCHMPNMDGYELTRAIREEEKDRLPIIAVTADALKGTAQQCYQVGMDDYLTKPLTIERLHSALAAWLPAVECFNEFHEDDLMVFDQSAVIDASVLAQLIGSDDSTMLKPFYEDFIRTAQNTVDDIQSAYEAVDYSVLSEQAHKLKSSARTAGAISLGECCFGLEIAAKEKDKYRVDLYMKDLPTLYVETQAWVASYG